MPELLRNPTPLPPTAPPLNGTMSTTSGDDTPSLPSWFILSLFLILFSSLYSSTLTTDYAFLDDYQALVEGPQGHPTRRSMREGRPLQALSRYLYLQTAKDIEDLRCARFAGILGISLLAWSVFHLFVREGWSRFQSGCVGVLMCTTLPFQIYAAWGSTANQPFAALASGGALLLSDQAFQAHRRCSKLLLAAGATLLLLAGLMSYQPAAMFFWVFAAVVLLKPQTPLRDMLRRFGWYSMIALISLLLGFATYQLNSVLSPDLILRAGLVHNLPLKIAWFFIESLPNALLFSFLSPARWFLSEGNDPLSFFYRIVDICLAWIILLIIVRGLVLYFHGTRKDRLWKCGIALVLLLFSYTPNLVIAENWATYRSLSSLTSLLVVLMCLALRGYGCRLRCRLFPGYLNLIGGCVAVVSAVSAAYHVHTYFVVPQSQELAVMREELMRKPLSQVHGIYVIGSKKGNTLAPLQRYEFGLPSSSDTVTARDMALLLIREERVEDARLSVTAVSAYAPLNPPPTDLVVDMRTLGLLSPSGNKSSTYWETFRRYRRQLREVLPFR